MTTLFRLPSLLAVTHWKQHDHLVQTSVIASCELAIAGFASTAGSYETMEGGKCESQEQREDKSNPTYWAIQRSWFARVNALCNLSHKKSREVAAHFRADF